MSKKKWEEAVSAWQRVKDQAEIDIEQADVYIKAANSHLNSLSELEETHGQ